MHYSDLEQEAIRYRNLIPAGVSHIEMSRSMVGIICDFYYNGIKYMIDVTPYSESQDILALFGHFNRLINTIKTDSLCIRRFFI